MTTDVDVGGSGSASLGGRYVVAEELGVGGVATVHRVRDTLTDRDVALKRLRVGTNIDTRRAEELFRQEYYTLSQLAHPNVVSVYDYGVDDAGPYYTMELLSGGDLLKRAPCEWRTACALARDVCSALSLIHSRRLIYRDLSPRNVRCTDDGRAKLLDFGALAPMGRVKSFVGTPAVSSPEAAHFQSLDARSDLYSLGATFYYALTGRRPYAANSLAQLPEAWRHAPPLPSDIVPGIPAALDALILELLHLDRALRPASAAEAMDRLSAIAALDRDDRTASVSRAYLSTPTLVGRDTSLGRFRRRMTEALADAGAAVLVQGPRGVGRSRFLDACILEAKLSGVTVLRVDGTDGSLGDYGIARALSTQLLDALPEISRACAAPDLAVLAEVAPGLRASAESASLDQRTTPSQTELQPVLRRWLTSVAEQRPLMIAVDDVHRLDAASTALVAVLGRAANEQRLIVAVTFPSEDEAASSSAIQLLASQGYPLRLGPLSLARVERLLRSVFGDVPNLQRVARRLHEVSKGLPRDLMQLAQQLVDEEVIRYTSGAWALPHFLDSNALPSDMVQARRARIGSLSEHALGLARALALGPDGQYTFDECLTLTAHGDAAWLMQSLNELVQAEIVSWSSGDYSLVGAGWRELLVEFLEPESVRQSCSRLAAVFERRGTEDFWAAKYLILAGKEERGLDALLRFSEASVRETTSSMEAFERLLQSLPDDWLDLFDQGFDLCAKFARSRSDARMLSERVTGIASQLPFDSTKYFAPVFEQLVVESGLDLHATLGGDLDPITRLQKSLSLAGERYASSAGRDYVLDPPAAVRLLGRMVARAIGNVSTTLSMPLLRLLPPLGPLTPLSPALGAWQTLVDGVAARMLSQREKARAIYVRQLRRLAEPDRAGLDETYQVTQVLGITLGLGTIEAGMGLASSLERAKALESSSLHEANAIRVRMLHHLWQGDPVEADRCKAQAELLTIERARRQTNECAHLLAELLANALSDDLTRVKRTMDAIEPFTVKAAGWRPVLHWAHAEYQRIRGNHATALVETERSLGAMDPTGHPVWPEVAGVHVSILLGLGREEDARTVGERYLREARERSLGYEQNYVRMPVAIALARLGARAEAIAHAEAVVKTFEELGSTGLNLGLAYETRARVCIHLADDDGFRRNAALCAVHYRTERSGPLAAKYERLRRDAQRAEKLMVQATRVVSSMSNDMDLDVVTILDGCETRNARATRMLEVLLESSGADEGFLFTMEAGGPVLIATTAEQDLPPRVAESAMQYLAAECQPDEATVLTDHTSAMKSEWTADGGHLYRPVLLTHFANDTTVVTGLAVLATRAGTPYRHPAAAAQSLSRVLFEPSS